MKIYFFSKSDGTEGQALAHESALRFFKENGILVVSNLQAKPETSAELSFEKMDGLVIEGSSSVTEAGYLIALALAQKKPVMYLLAKGSLLPDQLRPLQDNKALKKLFFLRHYSERNLAEALGDFISLIETGELRKEVPTIKFTLRFTPRADRYLTWKTQKFKLPKADYLRKMIDDAIAADEEYQSHLRSKFSSREKDSPEQAEVNPA